MYHVIYAPPNLGGFGFPSMVRWLCGEAQDTLSSYIAEVKTIYALSPKNHAWTAFLEKAAIILNQPFDNEVLIGSGSDPYAVRYKGIRDASGIVRQVMAHKLLEYATSQSFKKALELYLDKTNTKSVNEMIKSCTWDSAVLDEFLSSSPSEAVKSLISRAVSNELLNFLMPRQEKSRLQGELRSMDKKSMMYIADLKRDRDVDISICFEDLKGKNSYEVASGIRSRFYDAIGMSISNHTRPDPLLTLAHRDNTEESTITVTCNQLVDLPSGEKVSMWGENKLKISNMYDCYNSGTKFHGCRSKGMIDQSSQSYRALDLVQRCLIKSAALCAYVDSKGGDGGRLWCLVAATWGLEGDISYPSVSQSTSQDVSTKRISTRLNSRSHAINVFPNCQGLVNVVSNNLARFMDNYSIHSDLMSYVTSIRCSALLDVAGLNKYIGDRRYDFQLGSIPYTEMITFKAPSDEVYDKLITEISSSGNDIVRDWFHAATQEYSTTQQEEEDLIVDTDPTITASSVKFIKGNYGFIQPGTLLHEFGLSDGPVFRHVYVSKRDRGESDVYVKAKPFSVIGSYRGLSKEMTSVKDDMAASMSAICAEAYSKANKHVCEFAYTCTWSETDMISLSKQQFGDPNGVMRHLCTIMHKNMARVSSLFLTELFGKVSYSVKSVIMNADPSDEHDSLVVLGMLFLTHLGRFRTPEIYTRCALFDKEVIITSWQYARKRQKYLEKMYRAQRDSYKQYLSHYKQCLYDCAVISVRMISSAKEMVIAIADLLSEATNDLTRRRETKPKIIPKREYVLQDYGWQDSAADQIIEHLAQGMSDAGVPDGIRGDLWRAIRDVLNDVVMYVTEVEPVKDMDKPRPKDRIADDSVYEQLAEIAELKDMVLELPSATDAEVIEVVGTSDEKLSKEAKGHICQLYLEGELQ